MNRKRSRMFGSVATLHKKDKPQFHYSVPVPSYLSRSQIPYLSAQKHPSTYSPYRPGKDRNVTWPYESLHQPPRYNLFSVPTSTRGLPSALNRIPSYPNNSHPCNTGKLPLLHWYQNSDFRLIRSNPEL